MNKVFIQLVARETSDFFSSFYEHLGHAMNLRKLETLS
jgi:hypothetical protein